MRPLYDDFDEFEFELDFADSATAKKILREKLHERRRLASRRAHGSGKKRKRDDFDDNYEDDDFDEDYDEYNDYDDEDSDSYSDRDWD